MTGCQASFGRLGVVNIKNVLFSFFVTFGRFPNIHRYTSKLYYFPQAIDKLENTQ